MQRIEGSELCGRDKEGRGKPVPQLQRPGEDRDTGQCDGDRGVRVCRVRKP